MADDVEEFIRDHGIELPGLIGHSMHDFPITLGNSALSDCQIGVQKLP